MNLELLSGAQRPFRSAHMTGISYGDRSLDCRSLRSSPQKVFHTGQQLDPNHNIAAL